VAEVSDGGLVLTGATNGYGAGIHDLLLAKFDGSGNHLWTRTLGGTTPDVGSFVVEAESVTPSEEKKAAEQHRRRLPERRNER
jgi:hypothetical protein